MTGTTGDQARKRNTLRACKPAGVRGGGHCLPATVWGGGVLCESGRYGRMQTPEGENGHSFSLDCLRGSMEYPRQALQGPRSRSSAPVFSKQPEQTTLSSSHSITTSHPARAHLMPCHAMHRQPVHASFRLHAGFCMLRYLSSYLHTSRARDYLLPLGTTITKIQ